MLTVQALDWEGVMCSAGILRIGLTICFEKAWIVAGAALDVMLFYPLERGETSFKEFTGFRSDSNDVSNCFSW